MLDERATKCMIGDIEIKTIPVIRDKDIEIIRGKEIDESSNKSYMRTLMIKVGSELIASNYADSVLFCSELRLFDKGNEQNKFFLIEQKNKVINLSLQLSISKQKVYISKAEAEAFCRIFGDAKLGVSMVRMLEEEFSPSLEELSDLLGGK